MWLYLFLTGLIVMLAVCGLALWLGDRPAKLAGAACLAAWVGSLLAQNRNDYVSPQYGVAIVDIILLIAFIVLEVRYRRNWLIVAGGFQMLGVAGHLAYIIDWRIIANVRATASYFWAYLTLLSILYGTWEACKARRVAKSPHGA
jgi:hypothetical protein